MNTREFSVKRLSLILLFLSFALPSLAHAAPGLPYPQTDVGIFTDLAPRVTSEIPSWLRRESVACRRVNDTLLLDLNGHPVKAYPVAENGAAEAFWHEMSAVGVSHCALGKSPWTDRDHDGIPDTLDVMYGARKTALNGASYGGPYQRIKYPGGDVPRTRGVCTDVVVRALRNAGFDLQKMLIQDMERAPRAYRLGERTPNRSIEHRRVRRQIVFFKRKFKSLPTEFSSHLSGTEVWLPGDIVFMDTLPKAGPDHVGIVSDRTDSAGRPLIINNWDNGHQTTDMALLGQIPITHRFRITERRR